MKKLVGGVFLLSLLTLTLVQSVDGETYTSITDKNVLEQLTNLKSYINNPEMIKPVWVQLKNGDDIIVVQGQLSVVDDGEFDIDISIKGYSLTIHVEFTQATLEDSTPIDDWYIDTNDAKYLFTSDEQNISPIVEDYVESAESGTIANVLGLDSEGGLVKEVRNSVVKPIYWHTLSFQRGGTPDTSNISRFFGNMIILNNSQEPITLEDFKVLLNTSGFIGVLINAQAGFAGSDLTGMQFNATKIRNIGSGLYAVDGRDKTTNIESIAISGLDIDSGWVIFEDLGANRIN